MSEHVEYAVASKSGTIQMFVGEDRERAFQIVKAWNEGKSENALMVVMSRRVTMTDWTPANTGIVPPYVPAVVRQWEQGDPRV